MREYITPRQIVLGEHTRALDSAGRRIAQSVDMYSSVERGHLLTAIHHQMLSMNNVMREIVTEHNRMYPDDAVEWEGLPGIEASS